MYTWCLDPYFTQDGTKLPCASSILMQTDAGYPVTHVDYFMTQLFFSFSIQTGGLIFYPTFLWYGTEFTALSMTESDYVRLLTILAELLRIQP